MNESNPYSAPSADVVPEYVGRADYGGWRRLPYFLSTLVLFAIYFGVLLATTGASGNDGGAAAILGLAVIVFMVASVVIQVLRFKNIGRSGWNVLWTFVPVVNIYFYWMLMAVPEGFADHKVMDTAAKVITALLVLSIVLVVAVPFMIAGLRVGV